MIYPPLKRRDRELACTSVKFRRPYKLETTLDLGVLDLVARCELSLEKAWTASLPQAPYDSTTRGMQVHPSSEHLASLAECFLSSVATAADPAVRPTSERIKRWVKRRSHRKVKGSRLLSLALMQARWHVGALHP